MNYCNGEGSPVEWASQVFPNLAAKVAWLTLWGNPGECWEWDGMHHRLGYALVGLPKSEFPLGPKRVTASRALMILRAGRMLNSAWEHALHSCNHKWCVNPDHLRIGTPLENVADRIAASQPGSSLEPRGTISGHGRPNR